MHLICCGSCASFRSRQLEFHHELLQRDNLRRLCQCSTVIDQPCAAQRVRVRTQDIRRRPQGCVGEVRRIKVHESEARRGDFWFEAVQCLGEIVALCRDEGEQGRGKGVRNVRRGQRTSADRECYLSSVLRSQGAQDPAQ